MVSKVVVGPQEILWIGIRNKQPYIQPGDGDGILNYIAAVDRETGEAWRNGVPYVDALGAHEAMTNFAVMGLHREHVIASEWWERSTIDQVVPWLGT